MSVGKYIRTPEIREKMKTSHLGLSPTIETRKRMSSAGKVKVFSVAHRKNLSIANTGKHPTAETLIKLRESHLGKHQTQETKDKLREISLKLGSKPPSHKGEKFSEEHIRKIREAQTGEKGNNWQGGRTSEHLSIRNSAKYKNFREEVFRRDDYKCVMCPNPVRGGKLHADHIKPFAFYKDLRFDVNNGRNLCVSCHKKTETYGWKAKKYEKIENLVLK